MCALKKKPVNGMKDILPREKEIRDYVTSVITDTYKSYGFTPVETPCMEDIGNLTSRQGGENEKLIFKVLKRGEKLKLEEASTEAEVVDYGMRYDLTVPLSRFYANHANELPMPFKALQIGSVWRADRPQRGRYRQFTQCDIDIIGDASNLAEIELILATTQTLGRLGFKNFEIRINERRILKAMAQFAGFAEEDYEDVFITLDKMDKVGLPGVREELVGNGYSEDVVDKYINMFDLLKDITNTGEGLDILSNHISQGIDGSVADSLIEISEAIEAAKDADFKLIFDPTLVRGMSYYTGTIFEVAIPEFGGSCGGGGRYDGMVGRFTGHDVPACGFSIGFERIVLLLLESGFTIPQAPSKKAFLIEKGYPKNRIADIIKEAGEERSKGTTVLITGMNKNKKFQKENLKNEGYNEIKEFYRRDAQ